MYSIIEVAESAAESLEYTGTKEKYWCRPPALGLSLLKLSRPHAGEDWSEKVAAELAGLLTIPHAHYELATFQGRPGVLSPKFTRDEESLLLGNELVVALEPEYGVSSGARRYRTPQHTLSRVFMTLERSSVMPPREWVPTPDLSSAADVFIGYLMLDAWIGNTDRHHENWGIIQQIEAGTTTALRRWLAPTFDHASCLGRNEPDETRARRLVSRDRNDTVEAYAERAPSALYLHESDTKPLLTLDAFIEAGHSRPAAANAWLARLDKVLSDEMKRVVSEVPLTRLSAEARQFALRMLEHNRARLLRSSERIR